MQIHPNRTYQFDTERLYLRNLPKERAFQHGFAKPSYLRGKCLLLSLPPESLTHITSFLDPASLFALGKGNKKLYDHIKDDNTWRSAFLHHFLGLDSDRGTISDSSLSALLRRTEDTWKKEYVSRYTLIRHWERSRGGAVTHSPFNSAVAAMHLLGERAHGPALLSVSISQKMVARSFPLAGRMLSLQLAGSFFGPADEGVQLPSATVCAITSENYDVYVAWGFLNGEVAIFSANRGIEQGRNFVTGVRCRVADKHRGPVTSIYWDEQTLVTAGADGEVRVWPKTLKYALTLRDLDVANVDACVHVASNSKLGSVVVTKKSGRTLIWTGFKFTDIHPGIHPEAMASSPQIVIPPRSKHNSSIVAQPKEAKLFWHAFMTNSQASLGLHYGDDSHFYRVDVNLTTGDFNFTKFADGPIGPIRVLYPYSREGSPTGRHARDRTTIITGDSMGRVSMFDWSGSPGESVDAVPSFKRLDVCPDIDGGVTAISCTEQVLVVGTARGSTQVFDILSLRLLRKFAKPGPRHGPHIVSEGDHPYRVRQIIAEKDMLLVASGERILAWKGAPLDSQKGKVVKRANTRHRIAKWHKRLDVSRDVNEFDLIEADIRAHNSRSNARLQAQLATLEDLGLDEHEAVEYILMLSRDEEESRREEYALSQSLVEDGVFEGDFDDISSATEDFSSSSTSSHQTSPRTSPLFGPVTSNVKVQITPPIHPEPMEAGFSTSPLTLAGRATSNNKPGPSLEDADLFPSLSSSVSSTGASPSPRISPSVSAAGQWSRKLNISASSSDGGGSPGNIARIAPGQTGTPGQSLLSASLRMHAGNTPSTSTGRQTSGADGDSFDDDLRLAIELSLAEELSRQGLGN